MQPIQSHQLLYKQASVQFDFGNHDHQNVSDFLNHCHLNQYLDIFLSEGFDSISCLLEITEEDMIFMNVKRGHRRILQREIATKKGIPRHQLLVTNTMEPKYASEMTSPALKISMKNNESNYSSNRDQYSNAMLNSNTTEPLLSGLMSPRSISSTGGVTSGISGNSSSSGPIIMSRSRLQLQQQQQQGRNNDSGNSSGGEGSITQTNRVQATVSDNNTSGISSNEDNDSIDTNESAPIKRKYRRHAKPDRNAPIKPPSAYIMFSNDSRTELKDQNLSFAELAKIVGEQWKNLSHVEKQAYERMAMRAKDEYLADLEQYRQTSQYVHYQDYLNDFKSKQDAANRLIGRSRKRDKTKSPGSGSHADASSNGNSNGSGSSGNGSADGYGDKETVICRQIRSLEDEALSQTGNKHQKNYHIYDNESNHGQSRPINQQSSDSGYTSQTYYINHDKSAQASQWNNRSNQIMRGMLPVEFVPTSLQEKDDDDEEGRNYDGLKRRSPRFNKSNSMTT
ncbi:hypothetical protein INT48_009242 [Thamnidium elegans]|uniref:HMG box domain-containing protein n=1 Tax=Thamnidium elegans TaxID=101142 RepID=A0A8H7SKT8_9FUNG|nr:hypothetical protein INT48_009242 [Thamnidium elegans]